MESNFLNNPQKDKQGVNSLNYSPAIDPMTQPLNDSFNLAPSINPPISDPWWRKRWTTGRSLSRLFLIYHMCPVYILIMIVLFKMVLLYVLHTIKTDTSILLNLLILFLIIVFSIRIFHIISRLLFDLLASPPRSQPLLRELLKIVTQTRLENNDNDSIHFTHDFFHYSDSSLDKFSKILNDTTCFNKGETRQSECYVVRTAFITKILFASSFLLLIIFFFFILFDFFISLECSRTNNAWIWDQQSFDCVGEDCFFWCDIELKSVFVVTLVSSHFLVLVLSLYLRKADFDKVIPSSDGSIIFRASPWITVLVFDRLWEEVISDIRYISTLSSISFIPLLLLRGNIVYTFSSFLILCSGQALFYAILWLVLHVVVFFIQFHKFVTSYFLQFSSYIVQLTIVLIAFIIAFLLSLYKSWIMGVIVFISLISIIHSIMTRMKNYESSSFYHKPSVVITSKMLSKKVINWISIIFVFVMLIMLCGTIQQYYATSTLDSPHFKLDFKFHLNSSIDKVTLSTGVGDVIFSKAIMTFYNRDRTSKSSYTPSNYPMCNTKIKEISLIDYAIASQLSYLPPNVDQFDQLLSIFLPSFRLEYASFNIPHSTVRFYDLFSSKYNMSMIVVRGTNLFSLLDYIECIDLLVEAVTFQYASFFFPGLSLWPHDLSSHIVKLASSVDNFLANTDYNRYYYQDIESYLNTGGTMAKILGGRNELNAIAFAGPGILESRLKFNISNISLYKYIYNVVPTNDIVANLGTLTGSIYHLVCEPKTPEVCHSHVFTICDMIYHCGYDGLLYPQYDIECSGSWMKEKRFQIGLSDNNIK